MSNRKELWEKFAIKEKLFDSRNSSMSRLLSGKFYFAASTPEEDCETLICGEHCCEEFTNDEGRIEIGAEEEREERRTFAFIVFQKVPSARFDRKSLGKQFAKFYFESFWRFRVVICENSILWAVKSNRIEQFLALVGDFEIFFHFGSSHRHTMTPFRELSDTESFRDKLPFCTEID